MQLGYRYGTTKSPVAMAALDRQLMTRPIRLSVCVLLLASVQGCGPPSLAADDMRPDLRDLLDAGQPERTQDAAPPVNHGDAGERLDAGPADPPVVEERWAMKTLTSVLQTNPSPLGSEEKEVRTTTYMRLDVRRRGESFDWTEVLCHIETSPVRYGVISTRTSYSDAFVTNFPVFERNGSMRGNGDFIAGPYATVIGAELDDPLNDPLPQAAGEAGEVDGDSDGHPGVTVQVGGTISGEVYVAQRNIVSMRGRQRDETRIEGLLHSEATQVVLDASSGILRTRVESRRNPDDAASYFILRRMDSNTDCTAIVARADQLF
jgi:hypothetical protein